MTNFKVSFSQSGTEALPPRGELANRLMQVLQEAFKRHKIDKVRSLQMYELQGVLFARAFVAHLSMELISLSLHTGRSRRRPNEVQDAGQLGVLPMAQEVLGCQLAGRGVRRHWPERGTGGGGVSSNRACLFLLRRHLCG